MSIFEKPVDVIRSSVQKKVQESRLPTHDSLGYESTVGVYGGKLVTNEQGKLIFDMSGFISLIDRKGDALLRTYDEHTAKDPIEMLKKHPSWFFRFLAPGTKRYRGTPEEIARNAERLGLGKLYGFDERGIEVKDQTVFTEGRALQDIYRSDLIGSEKLAALDRFQALEEASKHIAYVHKNYGAIGEVLPSDILFRDEEASGVRAPTLNIPDIVYNEDKTTSEIDKKTTDLLDFTMSVGIEEMRRSQDWNEVQRAIRTIFDSYDDQRVVSLLGSFIKRGRLTMQGDEEWVGLSAIATKLRPLTAIHNKARLNFDKGVTEDLRELIVSECDEYKIRRSTD